MDRMDRRDRMDRMDRIKSDYEYRRGK